MANVAPQNVYIDQILTNLSICYTQNPNTFIAGQIFPVLPVQVQTGKFMKYDKGSLFRSDMGPRGLGQQPNQSTYGVSQGTYLAEELSEELMIDDRQRANAQNPLDPDRDAAMKLTQSSLIKQDQTWSSTYFAASAWTTNRTGVASGPITNQFLQFDQAGSDPVNYIRKAGRSMQRTTGKKPNVLVLGVDVYETLINHPSVIARFQYAQVGIIGYPELSRVFGVDKVVVAESVANSAAEGLTDNIDFIVGSKGMLLCYAAENPGLMEVSAGYIFTWQGIAPGFDLKAGALITRGRADRAKSDWFQGTVAWAMEITAPDLGIFFATAVS